MHLKSMHSGRCTGDEIRAVELHCIGALPADAAKRGSLWFRISWDLKNSHPAIRGITMARHFPNGNYPIAEEGVCRDISDPSSRRKIRTKECKGRS